MRDLLDSVELMTDEEAGLLLKAIIAHVDKGQIKLPRELQFAFVPIMNQLNRDCDKYDNYIEKQRVNGSKGGRPKNPNGLKENPKNPSLSKKTQKTLTVTVTDTVNDTNKNKTVRFSPPTLKEIRDYILEKSYQVDAERFFNFYESKNWMVGKNKMKKWKAAIANWEKSNGSSSNAKTSTNSSERFMENLRDIGGY